MNFPVLQRNYNANKRKYGTNSCESVQLQESKQSYLLAWDAAANNFRRIHIRGLLQGTQNFQTNLSVSGKSNVQ
uniref:Uncharacterized protein n=1 Tax=Ditylenchus dipsaci TaxID=166011 RepID=A0A915DRG3_9BILA